jgi:hypothetical protein
MTTPAFSLRLPRTLLFAALLGTFAVAGAVAAHDHGPARQGAGHGAGHGQGGHWMLKRMDADGDGIVTRAEAEAYRLARIAEMDADGDGYVTFEEMQAYREAQREKRARARFDRLDADGDGRVSVEELAAMGERGFDRMDRNADGVLSAEDRKGRRDGKHRAAPVN